MKLSTAVILVFLLSGCGAVDKVVKEYRGLQDQIKLGDPKEKVLPLLEQNQEKLSAVHKKPPQRFTRNGHLYDVYFARSGQVPDGATTDDEFTPYVFEDGLLTEIGWDFLGGPERTAAEVAREQAEIDKARASATQIEVNQEITQETK
jgi:hypothetical protein